MNENGHDENTQAESADPQETTQTGDDEELGISMGVENGDVIILFSQQLTTVGLPPDAAETMADALKKHAAEAREMRAKAGG